jgi:hypothetical protein
MIFYPIIYGFQAIALTGFVIFIFIKLTMLLITIWD